MSTGMHPANKSLVVGPWKIVYDANAAVVHNMRRGVESTSLMGAYRPAHGRQQVWSAPVPPQYVKDAAVRAVRKLRTAAGLPL